MADSRTAIANMALGMLNQDAIQTFDQPEDKTEETVALYFEETYEEVCADFPWNFCTTVAQLAETSNTPIGFSNSFAIPNAPKTLRVVGIEEVGNTDPEWERRGDELLVNSSECFIKYIFKVEDIKRVPAHIVRCISTLLAARMAIPLLGVEGQSLMSFYQDLYDRTVKPNATYIDANEGKTDVVEESTILDGYMVNGRLVSNNTSVVSVDVSGDFGTY